MEKNNIKILVVDDHPIVRDGIKTMLELGEFYSYNFTVLEASDKEETMSILKSKAIDIVLMDYQLEKIDGSSLTSVILNEYPEQLVLALSNYDNIEFTSSMLKAGARGYMTKNIKSDELFEAITT
ncbi:MAG: response regulator transcription factor, partial [Bacteroidota bacterium]|nr:response regulator transcription factor [Bacteroidota bacterium]